MALGERIKQIRKEQGHTQLAFAQLLGVSKPHISNVESGTANPSESLIKSICFTFGISELWLKTGEGQRDYSIVDQYSNLSRQQADDMNKGSAAQYKWGWIASSLMSRFPSLTEQNALAECLVSKTAADFSPILDHLIFLWYSGDDKVKARIETRLNDLLVDAIAYYESRKH
ncbi:MAG: helix-turn-helix transcriptional regulator [Eubacteriales bacterium]|nr:helix-turn-helix transcriptional regulator [Eubacteriales bacterium]